MTDTASLATTPLLDTAAVALCCFAVLAVTTGLHYEALRGLRRVLEHPGLHVRALPLLVMLALCVVHTADVLIYAGAFYALAGYGGVGTLGSAGPPSFSASLYFSFETYSSLGYGDIVPSGALRMVAGAEALNGLLLIGWSACHVHAVMDRLLERNASRPQPGTSPALVGSAASGGRLRRDAESIASGK